MGRLIRFELIKMFRQVSFYVCGGCIIAFSILSVSFEIWSQNVLGVLMDAIGQKPTALRFALSAVESSKFTIIIAIVVCIGICVDYSRKTFKNVWARGFTRSQVFVAKMISAISASVVYTLVAIISSVLSAGIAFGMGKDWDGQVVLALLLQIYICIAYTLVFVSVAFFVKNLAGALVICIVGDGLVSLGATLAQLIIDIKNFANHPLSYDGASFNIKRFILSENLSNMSAISTISTENFCTAFLVSTVYIVTFVFLAWLKLRKDEL